MIHMGRIENQQTAAIYTRISKDQAEDGHGVANQLADLEQRAAARGLRVTHRLSDNDIGVTRKNPTTRAKSGPAMRKCCGSLMLTPWMWSVLEVGPVHP